MKFEDIIRQINGDISFEEASNKYRLIKKIEGDGVCICKRSIKKMYLYQHEDESKDILILGGGCHKTLKDKGYFGERFPKDIIKTKTIEIGKNTKTYNDQIEYYNNYKVNKCKYCKINLTRYNYDYCGKCDNEINCKSCNKEFKPRYKKGKDCKSCYNNKTKRECVNCETLFKIKFENQIICAKCYYDFLDWEECLTCQKTINEKYFFCYKCNKKHLKNISHINI
jgi:hypothetical protein